MALEVIGHSEVPNKFKRKFYHTAIQPIILYDRKCWALNGQ